jgi:hypothetical protein
MQIRHGDDFQRPGLGKQRETLSHVGESFRLTNNHAVRDTDQLPAEKDALHRAVRHINQALAATAVRRPGSHRGPHGGERARENATARNSRQANKGNGLIERAAGPSRSRIAGVPARALTDKG